MLRLSLFGLRLFRSANLITFASAAGFLGGLFVYPLMLQTAFGYSPLTAGLMTFPEAIGIMIGTQVAARLYPRVGPRRLIAAGQALVATVLLCLAFVMSTTIPPVLPGAADAAAGLRPGAHLHADPGRGLRHRRAGAHRCGHRAVQRHPAGRVGGRRRGGGHGDRHHRDQRTFGAAADRRECGPAAVPLGPGRLRAVLGGRVVDRRPHRPRRGRRTQPWPGTGDPGGGGTHQPPRRPTDSRRPTGRCTGSREPTSGIRWRRRLRRG